MTPRSGNSGKAVKRQRLTRLERAARNERLRERAVEVGVEAAAAELGLGRSYAFELCASPPVQAVASPARANVDALTRLLASLGADPIAEAIARTPEPAKTVGRLLDGVATWVEHGHELVDDGGAG